MTTFGFKVKQHTEWDDDYTKEVVVPGQWRVFLPHQCDAWDIAGESGTFGDAISGEPHADAITELEAFIAEAVRALDALKAGREFDAEVES